MATTFTGLDPYKLSGINVTDRILGRGAYATVVELEYMGLKCAGKKIHELLLAQGNTSYAIHHFQKECQLMSRLHHPNIVQFLGVYFQSNTQVPILVMEYLPTNLTSCIEDYGVLPSEIGYPILHGVALGLCFLHNQIPPVIHRDLSSNNVLLNSNLTAKVSDLGVARILNMNRMQASRMTQIPGTPAYMPPETMGANPDYSASVDIFSYGVMIIHVLSGQWPEPQGGQIRIDGDKLIPVSEAERRSTFLEAIGKDHSLMKLILQCISNNPQLRPVTNVIVKQLAELVKECSSDVSNQLDRMVRSRTESEIDSEGRNRAETMRSGCIRRRPVYKVKAPSSMELDTPKEATIVRRQLSDSAMPVTSNKVSSSPGSEETVVGSDGAGKMRGSPGLVSKLSKELELSIVSKQGTVTDEKQSISPSSLEEREPESAVSQKVHAANYINIQTMCLGDVHKVS